MPNSSDLPPLPDVDINSISIDLEEDKEPKVVVTKTELPKSPQPLVAKSGPDNSPPAKPMDQEAHSKSASFVVAATPSSDFSLVPILVAILIILTVFIIYMLFFTAGGNRLLSGQSAAVKGVSTMRPVPEVASNADAALDAVDSALLELDPRKDFPTFEIK